MHSFIFANFLPYFKVDYAEDFEKSSKIWQKMKKWKINFSFLIPHFSPINEKLKKPEKQEFLVIVQPIVMGLCIKENKSQNNNIIIKINSRIISYILKDFQIIVDWY